MSRKSRSLIFIERSQFFLSIYNHLKVILYYILRMFFLNFYNSKLYCTSRYTCNNFAKTNWICGDLMRAKCLVFFYSGGKFVAVIATDHRLGRTIGRSQKEMKKRTNRANDRVICQEVPAGL